MNIQKTLFAGLLSAAIFAMVGCSNSTPASTDQSSTTNQPTQAQTMNFDQSAAPKSGDTIAVIDTDLGTIKLKLFTDLAPEISKNLI